MYELIEEAFDGVVRIVTLKPRRESSFARSSSGRVWP